MVPAKALHGMESMRLLLLLVVLLSVHLFVANSFYRSVIQVSMVFAIAAAGLTMLIGFAGQISLCQGAFMAVGAYGNAWLLQHAQWHPLVSVAIAALACAAIGWAIARPVLRLAGHYLALATLALATSGYILATQWRSATGGLDPGVVDLPRFAPMHSAGDELFLFTAAMLVLYLGVSLALVNSRVGRALKVVRVSEVAAACMGIDVVGLKTRVFAWAAAGAGLAGALYALFLRSFNAGTFGVGLSIDLLMMVIVGSLSTLWGSLLGAVLIVMLPHLLESFDSAKLLIYGVAMIAIIMFVPDGLASGLWRAVSRRPQPRG